MAKELVVIKRDGSKVPFNQDKIFSAIERAERAVFHQYNVSEFSNKEIKKITKKIVKQCHRVFSDDISVEQIQSIVEAQLIKSKKPLVAKTYIEYRQVHSLARDEYTTLMETVKNKIMAMML